MRLVLVEWNDAASLRSSGWKSIDEANDLSPSLVRSVGWLAVDHADYVVIVSHTADSDKCDGEVCIPRGMISRVADLVECLLTIDAAEQRQKE